VSPWPLLAEPQQQQQQQQQRPNILMEAFATKGSRLSASLTESAGLLSASLSGGAAAAAGGVGALRRKSSEALSSSGSGSGCSSGNLQLLDQEDRVPSAAAAAGRVAAVPLARPAAVGGLLGASVSHAVTMPSGLVQGEAGNGEYYSS
jgi:hypothetical protein